MNRQGQRWVRCRGRITGNRLVNFERTSSFDNVLSSLISFSKISARGSLKSVRHFRPATSVPQQREWLEAKSSKCFLLKDLIQPNNTFFSVSSTLSSSWHYVGSGLFANYCLLLTVYDCMPIYYIIRLPTYLHSDVTVGASLDYLVSGPYHHGRHLSSNPPLIDLATLNLQIALRNLLSIMDRHSIFSFKDRRRFSTSSWHMLNMTALPEAPDDIESTFEGASMDGQCHSLNVASTEEDCRRASQRSESKEKQVTHRRSTKSLSKLSHAFSELRSISRRASMSIRRKSTLDPQPGNILWEENYSGEDKRPSTSHHTLSEPTNRSKSSGWLRRVASSGFRQKRDSSANLTPSPDRAPYSHSVTSPVPGSGSDPPILPYDPARGAAARAAAAAQNEMLGVGRVLALRDDARLSESKIARDSESGIGIDLRDRTDEPSETAIAIVRKGRHL